MKNKKMAANPKADNLNNQEHNTTKMLVLSMLNDKPQDRYKLSEAIGISEREFRRIVHDLRMEGHAIISSSKGGGYRLGTKKEALVVATEMRAKVYDMLRTANRLEGIELIDQISMEEFYNEIMV